MDNLRRRSMGGGLSGAMFDGSEAKALDVLFSSNDGSELCIISGQENWPSSGWTPIGIVVVPGSHNRYGDNTCGVMSLVSMDYNNPETGVPVSSASQVDSIAMYWGRNGSAIGNGIFSSTDKYPLDYTEYLWLYQDEVRVSISGTQWPYTQASLDAITDDPVTNYSNSGTYPYVSATSGIATCDFNGVRNTAAIYVATRSLIQWTNNRAFNTDVVYTAPAACAGRYKTTGTSSFVDIYADITSNNSNYGTPASTRSNTGFWYFPAVGELSYIPSKKYYINNTIVALNLKYGNVGTQLNNNLYTHPFRLWASSEYSSTGGYGVSMFGNIDSNIDRDNGDYCCVRAFLRF